MCVYSYKYGCGFQAGDNSVLSYRTGGNFFLQPAENSFLCVEPVAEQRGRQHVPVPEAMLLIARLAAREKCKFREIVLSRDREETRCLPEDLLK